MNAFDLIIFDCDGVLVDSEPLANRLMTEHLGRLGLPYTFEKTVQTFMGKSMASSVEIIEAELGRPVPEDFVQNLQAETFAAFRLELEPVAGVKEALDALGRQGFKTCVASSGDHDKLKTTLGLTGLYPRFEGRIFSATEVARGKPHPDLFLHAARRMEAEPSKCIVIEDSLPGVQAAARAGMTVLGYAARSDATTLAAAGAQVFDDMAELPGIVAELSREPAETRAP